MKRLYSKRRYLGGVRKFKECNELSRRIQEGDKGRRSAMSREEEGKIEGSGSRTKSRSRKVQEERVTREVYSKNFVWVG